MKASYVLRRFDMKSVDHQTISKIYQLNFTSFSFSVISSYYSPRILISTQPAITCSKLTIETLEQGVKYVQS